MEIPKTIQQIAMIALACHGKSNVVLCEELDAMGVGSSDESNVLTTGQGLAARGLLEKTKKNNRVHWQATKEGRKSVEFILDKMVELYELTKKPRLNK